MVDATGHSSEIARIVERKAGMELNTKTGKIVGEGSMWAEVAEDLTPKNSKVVCPGLYAAGMAANAVFGGPRMGPIFGGMLLSGRKVADDISGSLSQADGKEPASRLKDTQGVKA